MLLLAVTQHSLTLSVWCFGQTPTFPALPLLPVDAPNKATCVVSGCLRERSVRRPCLPEDRPHACAFLSHSFTRTFPGFVTLCRLSQLFLLVTTNHLWPLHLSPASLALFCWFLLCLTYNWQFKTTHVNCQTLDTFSN